MYILRLQYVEFCARCAIQWGMGNSIFPEADNAAAIRDLRDGMEPAQDTAGKEPDFLVQVIGESVPMEVIAVNRQRRGGIPDSSAGQMARGSSAHNSWMRMSVQGASGRSRLPLCLPLFHLREGRGCGCFRFVSAIFYKYFILAVALIDYHIFHILSTYLGIF